VTSRTSPGLGMICIVVVLVLVTTPIIIYHHTWSV